MKTFGERRPGTHYTDRPGAYGIAIDPRTDRVAVMRTDNGHFLPGGGTDPGESDHETLAREVREECGRAVEVGRRIGDALQYVTKASDGNPYAKQCTFYEVWLGEQVAEPIEEDHSLVWMPLDEARERLTHESQRWALEIAESFRQI